MSVTDDRVKVVIADDDEAIRSYLVTLISSEPWLDLTGAAADAAEAIELTLSTKPDLVVLDWWMPAGGGPRAACRIVQDSPETVIIAFSAYAGEKPTREMLEAGADDYLLKSRTSSEAIRAAIRRAVPRAGPGGP